MLDLSPAQRKFLKSLAHDLKPVVMIGSSGLTDAVLREAARGLDAHELIKIRVLNGDRMERASQMLAICEALGAAPVQHIGKLLLIYRPAEPPRIRLP
ncbi:MAG: YhbY family RNA-binding protein [Thiobacillaceae bacterium]